MGTRFRSGSSRFRSGGRSKVAVTEGQLPFALITPTRTTPPDLSNVRYHYRLTPSQIDDLISEWEEADYVAIDFETRGTRPYLWFGGGEESGSGSYPVGLGAWWDSGDGGEQRGCYIDLTTIGEDAAQYLYDRLISDNIRLLAHNVYFDSAWLYRATDRHPNWLACTYGLLYQCANEGFDGQRWSLKWAMRNILGWRETNEERLDRWLIGEGYVSNTKRELTAGYYWYPEWVKERKRRESPDGKGKVPYTHIEGRYVSPDKSEMWRAPAEILGHYCVLDCAATYQLYREILTPVLERFPGITEYHREYFLPNVEVLIEAYLTGIPFDYHGAEKHERGLVSKMEQLESELRTHPDCLDYIRNWESERYSDFLTTEPPEFRKVPECPTEPEKYLATKPVGKEPNRLTKKGAISQHWLAWEKRKALAADPPISTNWIRWKENVEAGKYDPTHPQHRSKRWEEWREKRRCVEELRKDGTFGPPIGWSQKRITDFRKQFRFNIGSDVQLRDLLYTHLQFPVRVWTEKPKRAAPDWKPQPATSGDALLLMGDVGKLLIDYSDADKERSYVRSYIDLAVPDPSRRGHYRIHPSFRVPGTLTGRLAGKDPNIQQVPKTWETLSLFGTDPGYVLIDNDHAALEGVVLAELSGDPGLLSLYGPDAGPNDIHLFVGSQLPIIGDAIRAAGYDPDNPTAEGIAAAKRDAKEERDISKTVNYAAVYGAGAQKLTDGINLDLEASGSSKRITLAQGRQIHSGYHNIFGGVKDYEAQLREEWRVNDGWVMGPLGYPICCAEKRLKDLVNRVVQRTGHDIHMRYVVALRTKLWNCDLLDDILWYVPDWHDETIVQAREEIAPVIARAMEERVYQRLNNDLAGTIPLTGGAEVVTNLAEAKEVKPDGK